MNIILADNQDITRIGIECLLQTINSSLLVVYAANKADVMSCLVDDPDSVVILDYTLSDFGSYKELLVINQRFPKSHWILFSEELSNSFLRQLFFNSSAFSMVLKTSDVDEINMALKQALRSERFVCSRVTNQLFSTRMAYNAEKEVLTATEKEIIKEIALGKTTKEIAADRNLSIHTIITHRKNIFRKMEVNNVQEAIKYAMRAGIIDVSDYYI